VSAQRDPELDDLFQADPELRDLSQFLRASPHPAAQVEPTAHFRVTLRRRLMREAWEQGSKPALPWHRRLFAPATLAWASAAVGALLIVFTAFQFATAPKGSGITVTVRSPQNASETVSQVTPIELDFSQPMDAASVERAVAIQPATNVQYSWQDQNRRLKITPVNDLAPNTRYQVTVQPSAQTRSGRKLSQPAVVQFITASPAPKPTPTPSTSPSSTPQGSLSGVHAVAPIGSPAPQWSPDGSKLFVVAPTSGALQAWPLQGAPAPIEPDGVTLVEVGPDGNPAYVRNGTVTYDGTTITGVQPVAIGFRRGGLVLATASDVQTGDQRRLVSLNETATAADFSPAGDLLVYRGASGLHLVDLNANRDNLVGRAAALGDWAPDGRHYAFATDTALMLTDGTSTVKLADVPGVTGLSWSRGNQILLTSGAGLQTMSGDGSQLKTVPADGSFAQPVWAPVGGGTFAFRRSSEVWVAKLQGAAVGIVTPITPGVSQDDLVNSFMAARRSQLADQAVAFLDTAGKDAFSRLSLVYGDPSTTFARYYVLLSQPGRVTVRLVLTKGTSQTAIDETLLLRQDAAGHLWIHGASETVRSSFGSGPEIVKAMVVGDRVLVFFDSDLNPGTVQGGSVGIKGVSTQATYDASQKMVTLTANGGLTAGASYDLLVGSGLQDVQGHAAVQYDLPFTGTAS